MSDQPTQPPAAQPPAAQPPAAQPPASTAPPPVAPNSFPAPGAATWGQGAAPAAANKRKPGVIIAAATSAVFVLGGAFALLNSTRHESTKVPVVANVGPTIDPNAGPTPAPPKPPPTVPGPVTPPIVTLPPPSTAPATTTTIPATPTGPTNGNNLQTVTGPVSVAVPDGWTVDKAKPGFVLLSTNGAEYRVKAGKTELDAEAIAADWIQNDTEGVDDLVVTDSGSLKLPSGKIVSGFTVSYTGVLATQQGSQPVEGTVIVYIGQSGLAVLTETFNAQGDFENHLEDYTTMLRSVVSTLQ